MTTNSMTAKLAATIAFAGCTLAPACAQTMSLEQPTKPAFALTADSSPGHVLLLVSAIVLFVGLIDDDRTLEVLGGVGILLSIVEFNQKFALQQNYKH